MYVSPKELSSLLSFVLVSRAAHPLVGVATLAAGGSRSVDENSVDPLAGPERRDADGQGVAVDEQVDGRGDAHEGVTEEGVGRNTCVIDVIIVIFFTPTHARTQSRDWRLKAGRNSTRWRRLTGLGAVRQLMGQLGRSLQAQRVVAEDQEVEQATGRREAGVDRQPVARLELGRVEGRRREEDGEHAERYLQQAETQSTLTGLTVHHHHLV